MRVTNQMQAQMTLLSIQSTFQKMSTLQSQISSGNKIQNSSDDPVGALQILQNNTLSSQLATNLTAMTAATNTLQTSVSALTQAQTALSTAVNSGLTAANATSGTSNAALAAQVNEALNSLLGIANTQLPDGTYIFGGTANNVAPYAVTNTNSTGQPQAVTYQGNDQSSQVIVGQSTTVTTLLPGSSIFASSANGETAYSGTTGAQAGTGTDSATGTGTLLIQHTITTYYGNSGVSTGASSYSGDTVLGQTGANTLFINDTSGNGSSGTITLNGGPPVNFSNLQNNLKVTGPSGEAVYVDMSSITPGFNGTVNLSSDGTLSVDGGLTTTDIDFSANQVVTDSHTGAVTNVNSKNIHTTGSEQLTYPAATDLFQTLISLRDTINNTHDLTSTQRSAALNQQIGILQNYTKSISVPLGNQSTQSQFLANLQTRTTSLQSSLKLQTNDIQATDMPSAIVALQQQQNLYQAALQMTASMGNLSLVNFLR